MTETELQATIKRQEQQIQQLGMQANQMQQMYFALGGALTAVIRELLLAIVEPGDPESVESAKKHAREMLKGWDKTVEAQQRRDSPAAAPVIELKSNAS